MKIEFSTDTRKNTTIILAKNSTGKTTLMQAIKWCLYGDDYVDLENKKYLLNSVVQDLSNKAEEPIIVELAIEEKGITYIIRRKRYVNVSSNKIITETLELEYLNFSGETIQEHANTLIDNLNLSKINRIINRIISKEMAQYFLFDGERIDQLGSNTRQSKNDIKNAINAINGFHILDNAVESLTEIRKTLNKSFTEKVNDKELTLLQSEIETKNSKIDDNKETIKELVSRLKEDEKDLENIDNELQSTVGIQNLAADLKKFEQEEKYLSNKIKEADLAIIIKNREYRSQMIISKLQEKYKVLEFNENAKGKTIPNMQATSIDAIIKRGICICGEPITEQHENHLMEQRSHQPPISNAELVFNFKQKLTNNSGKLDVTTVAIESNIDNRIREKEKLTYTQENLEETSSQIGSYDSESVKKLHDKRKVLNDEISKIKIRIAMLEEEIINLENLLLKFELEYEKLFKKYNQFDYEKIRLDLVNSSLEDIEAERSKHRASRLKDIEELANKHLTDIIYKFKTIKIDKNFEYSIFEENGKIASPSEGERVAISMSLILSIIDGHKLALKEKQQQKNTYISEREFTLVMDAAFAKLDSHFSKKIAGKLPQSVEQIILFSTEKQYDGAVKEGLQKNIGKVYVLHIPDGENENSNALTNDHLKKISG